ncbi:SRC kinase signaling inhibitor 1-like isoform X3 [Phyllopteryx taeniolatus]|uniref:SRC kinase signaling inhibitor 1-like isoform X3 n=1 Tax=Phyllopteryx taeniolatus TaxID=161469 RepID=UPI002AD599DB|nr:SRC kinase signaling inhibitor 1-like isoform X3 [Phyllopteryx taeniolatus]
MGNSSFPGQEKRRNPMISASDVEFPRDYRPLGGGALTSTSMSPSPDRRRKSAGAGSPEAPNGVRRADVVFADEMRGSTGGSSLGGAARGRQSRTPRPSPTRNGRVSFSPRERPGVMADRDVPGGFSRADRLRQSLPLARSSANPAKLHTPGVLFLQLGEETRRVHLTHELGSLDTLRALIVHMFPQRLTMATLRSPSTALLIKDESRNVFYELEDPRDVRDRCVVKIYCKEPAVYGTHPGHRDSRLLANGDLRREMVYAPQDSPPGQRLGAPATPSPHSSSPPQGSPSRTRFLFGGGGVRPSSYAGAAGRRRAASPAFAASSGAILERRDVKPDEEAGGARGVMLLRADERGGGGVYADPYSLSLDARVGLAGAPRSPLPGRADPYGSLYRRGPGGAAVCSLMEGGGLYRAGGTLYDDTYAASVLAVGLRVPALSSPQNIPDARDAYAGTLPSRGSPARGERRRDSLVSSAGGDSPRSRGLTSEQLCLMAAVAGGDVDGVRGDETETRERMEVMEKQIASLTGLLQRVLSRAPEDHSPDKTESASDGSGTDPGRAKKKRAASPSGPLALMPPPPPPPSDVGQPPNVSRAQMQRHLLGLQQSTNVLRTQLSQLRNMQLSNQDCAVALLRQTEAELSVLMLDAARTHEDPLQRQRLLVEEERRKYLTQEETLAHQLHLLSSFLTPCSFLPYFPASFLISHFLPSFSHSLLPLTFDLPARDLERWVENLQESPNVRPRSPVSQLDLRQKTQELKTLADTLDCLKSQFPGLQSKMRVVLRVEVEAVKFLKEEPHRLDALLQRCNSIRDSLGSLRRQASEKEQDDAPSRSQTSFPLSLTGNWMPGCAGEQDKTPSVSFRSRVGSEKSLNAQAHVSADVTLAAERDWEEKRASLTQFSAQDINRLLEATQAELLKALPDLDFAAKTATKPAVPPKPLVGVAGEPTAGKVQLAAQKLNSVEGAAPPRGSADMAVARCRAEKASKSPPPPPPPRRTFPSAHAANRAAGVNNKSTEMEDGEAPVKLRRTPYEVPRPASTPPTAAPSGLRDDYDGGGGIEKETVGGSPASVRGPTVAARLKHLEQGGRKSKEEVKAFPGSQQQVFHF